MELKAFFKDIEKLHEINREFHNSKNHKERSMKLQLKQKFTKYMQKKYQSRTFEHNGFLSYEFSCGGIITRIHGSKFAINNH